MKTPRFADLSFGLTALLLTATSYAASFPIESVSEFETKLGNMEKAVENALPIPNLKIETRRRGLRWDILHARTLGGLSFDVESRSHMGRIPTASLAVADESTSLSMRADFSHERFSVGGLWQFRAASISLGLDEDGSCRSGLSLRLNKTQSLDYSVRSGSIVDHRVGWSLRVRL